MFSAFICSSVFSHFWEELVGLGVLRNLIDSSAHHWAREIIVTQGRFQFQALETFQMKVQIKNTEKNQNIFRKFIFFVTLDNIKHTCFYKVFLKKCKQIKENI